VLLIPKRHRQTDGRTDRQTDGRLTVALPRSALASRGKKRSRNNKSAALLIKVLLSPNFFCLIHLSVATLQ